MNNTKSNIMTRPKSKQRQQTNSPFKRLRLNAGFSQEVLAQKIGVAVSTIRRWEKGTAEPTMTIAQMRDFCIAIKQNFHDLPNSLLPPSHLETQENETKSKSKTKVGFRHSLRV